MKKIFDLVKKYPNNAELGAEIRKLYWDHIDKFQELEKEMADSFIFESPDGGNIVYERKFGKDISERTLVTDKSQLSLFPDYK